MERASNRLKDLLLPTERLILTCIGQKLPTKLSDKPKRPEARVLAVVSHNRSEEACLFILEAAESATVAIDGLLPLTLDLQLSLDQFSSASHAVSANWRYRTAPASGSNFILTLATSEERFEFLFEELESLRGLVETCRRFVELAEPTRTSNQSDSHNWALVYSQNSLPRLRQIKQLTNSLFPKISTGNPDPTPELSSVAGDRSQESSDYLLLRNAWLLKELYNGTRQFCAPRVLRLHIGTFNVNGRSPSEDLSSWVKDSSVGSDVLVLGFQELDLSAEALLYSTSNSRELAWTLAVINGLGDEATEYEKVASKQLVGMLLLIFVRRPLSKHVRNVETTSLGTGIMGLMGNKGAVAVRLTLLDTTLCFVNSHFAAFEEMVHRRNADFSYLAGQLSFGQEASNVFESHALFWLVSDHLNYRIDMPDDEVRQLIRDQDWQTLRLADQLIANQHAGLCFEKFTEMQIDFSPSYRFAIGSADPLAHDSKRRPAWTDRVVYRTASHTAVKQVSYDMHPLISLSDHKPVSARADIEVEELDWGALNALIGERIEYLDDFAEAGSDELLPVASVSSTLLDFGDVKFATPAKRIVTISNEGQVPCAFSFVPYLPEKRSAQPWLTLSPTSGFVPPGMSQTVEVLLEVSPAVATVMNSKDSQLEDILILHLVHGKDVFIPVRAAYQKTCFCNDLSFLVRLPGPIRSFSGEGTLLPEAKALSAPRELLRMIAWVMSHAAHSEMFRTKPPPSEVAAVRERLDLGLELLNGPLFEDTTTTAPAEGDATTLAVGECLLQFLHALPEPVVPSSLDAQCASASNRDEAFEVVSDFPPVNANVWIAVTSLVHYVVRQGGNQALQAKDLAIVFTPALFRYDVGLNSPLTPVKQRAFFSLFINDE